MTHETTPIRIAYMFDPLCGWCYGAAPVLDRLRRQPGLDVALVPVGLFAGDGARPMSPAFADYAWENDRRIAALTGQVFSDAYRRRVLGAADAMFDSGPAILALMAVRHAEPLREFEALELLQTARYVDGRDNASSAGVRAILATHGFTGAMKALDETPEAIDALARDAIATGRGIMMEIGANGVPTLAVIDRGGPRAIGAPELLGNFTALLARINRN